MARIKARLGGLPLRSVGPAGSPGRIFFYPRLSSRNPRRTFLPWRRRFGAASHSRSDEGRDALYVLRHAAARTRHPPRRLLAPASATGYRPEV